MLINNNHQNPNCKQAFGAKIHTKTLLECTSGVFFDFSPMGNMIRSADIVEISGITPEQFLKTKNFLGLKIYMHVLGQRILNKYPKFKKPTEKIQQYALMLNEMKAPAVPETLKPILKELTNKYGTEVDIELNEGEKKFLGNYLDKCFDL